MTKLLGAALILLACVSVGQWAARSLKNRVDLLSGLQQGLVALGKEISYSATSMSEALQRVSTLAGQAGRLFAQAGTLLRQGDGITAGEAWQQAVAQQTSVDAELRSLLELPAAGLGLSDVDSQVKQLELCRERLREAEQRAEERERQYGKICRSMSWACGAVLVLFLL